MLYLNFCIVEKILKKQVTSDLHAEVGHIDDENVLDVARPKEKIPVTKQFRLNNIKLEPP